MTMRLVNGCSTCPPGDEQYERYKAGFPSHWYYQYDYRTPDGILFSCVSRTLENARARRDAWFASREAVK